MFFLTAVTVGLCMLVCHILYSDPTEKDCGYVITGAGDTFHVYYDPEVSRHGTYFLRQDDTDFEMYKRGNITADDLVLINDEKDLRVYMFSDAFFIYKGAGSVSFVKLDGLKGGSDRLDDVVMPHILSGYGTVDTYFRSLAEKYPDISAKIITAAEQRDYAVLEEYGMTDNDHLRDAMIKHILYRASLNYSNDRES